MGQNVSKLIDQYIAAGDPNIDLSGKHLSELPPEVERLAPLVVRLGLSQNLLSSLPVEVSRLGQLRYLNIRANHFREFPKALCDLPCLEILDISRNKIQQLPAHFGQLMNLKVLSISKNRIQILPRYLGDMQRLKLIKIEGNPLVYPPHQLTHYSTETPHESWLQQLKAYLRSNPEPLESDTTLALVTSDIPKKLIWAAPHESQVYRYGCNFSQFVESTLSQQDPNTNKQFNTQHEAIKSLLTSVSIFAKVSSYCVCGRSDNEIEMQFIITHNGGLNRLGERLIKHLQSAEPRQAEVAKDLKEGILICRRLVHAMQTKGLEGLGAMDIRNAKRLLLEWYSGLLCFKEIFEVTDHHRMRHYATMPSSKSTITTAGSVLTATPATISQNTNILQVGTRHQRSSSNVSNPASTTSSSTTSMIPSGTSRSFVSQTGKAVETALHVIHLLETLINSPELDPTRRQNLATLISELEKQIQTTREAATRLEKQMNGLTMSALDTASLRRVFSDTNTFVAQVTRLGSVAKNLSKEYAFPKHVVMGLQSLTRVTRALALHLRSPGSAASSEAGSSIIQ